MLEGCLRATISTPEQNDAFIRGLRDFLSESRGSARGLCNEEGEQ